MNDINTGIPISILLVGSGKFSRHLTHWFNLNNKLPIRLLTWNRHQSQYLLHQHLLNATHVWLAISDSSIVPFYEKYLINYLGTVVHFSGALQDRRIICTHPLMSFPEKIYCDNFYSSIHFALTGCEKLSFALPGFNNLFFLLPAELKPFYHALCVVAGNFPQILWSEVHHLLALHNIPSVSFDVYIKKITENFLSMKEKSITGPILRKEILTINKNIEALSGTSLQSIYQLFIQEFLK